MKPLAWIGLDTEPGGASRFEAAIYSLLVFVPIALAVRFLNLGGIWLFATSAAAIIPLAKILSTATEHLASRLGAGIGGLLSATFGNAVEMIIAFFALQAGLYDVVKASITGTIMGNMLFVLGLSIFLGGIGREKQTFNRTAAGVSASQLTLAAAGLFIPAAFVLTTPASVATTDLIEELSVGVALLLLVGYAGQMVFTLGTHKHLYSGVGADTIDEGNPDDGDSDSGNDTGAESFDHSWTIRHSLIVLVGTTVVVSVMAEMLVEGLEYLTNTLGLSELFVGVVIVALVGGAAENVIAVTMAMKNKMELALNVVMGSTLQISLFVAPVLVLLGLVMNRPLSLTFNLFEVATVIVTIMIANGITRDGESNWFEGVQLLITYAIIAVAFFFHP
jgi:Ca2+:H+ antiporter